MAGRPFSRRSRSLDVRQQAARIRLIHPGFECRVKGNRLICRGRVQPTQLNESYLVRLEYEQSGTPKVWVEEPKLRQRSKDEPTPHTYQEDCPCLYLPGAREWTPSKLLATTIIPWLSLWLFYYESWLVTGEWQGGGEHPDLDDEALADLDIMDMIE